MKLILSGATGYVGKHVAARLLELGHEVWVLARSRNTGARERVLAALAPFAPGLPRNWQARIGVVEGDVTQAACGVGPGELAALRAVRLDAFIHCAGLTRFEEHLRGALFAHNLDGTRNARQLAQTLGCARFHHISTAFVAGRAPAEFGARDLARGQAFNNPYEASKFAAEQYLHELAVPGTVIYRPAIVVGGHPLGEANAVSTVYTFIKAMHFLRECYRRDSARGRGRFIRHGLRETAAGFHMPIRVAADPCTNLYLVSIHSVTNAIVARLRAELPAATATVQLSGRAYPLGSVRDALCTVMRISGPRLVAPDAFVAEPRNAVEAHFFRLTRSYAPYLLAAPRFPAADPAACERIDLAALTRDFLRLMTGRDARPATKQVGAMAVDLRGIRTARDYFDELTRADIGRHFLGRHRYVDAAIRFRIHGAEKFDQIIEFSNGLARYAGTAGARAADCAYELDETLFLRVISGECDLRAAFFAGKVAISGNKETALKFGSLLSHYYRDIEDNLIEEIAL
tara:strand:+ start:4347 stop:5894 length:1548 start_codon:yes stop_codon:yes gene_type:complete